MSRHLRLVKPGDPPAPRPYPALPQGRQDAFDVRRVATRWLVERIVNGRLVSFTVSSEELEDFATAALARLSMNREDR